MMLKNVLRAAVLSALLAASATGAAAAVNPGSCQAAPNNQRKNCTILSSSCAQGYLPNPGVYPSCACTCQATNASKAPPKEEKTPKPKP